jgi:hypothetical protein
MEGRRGLIRDRNAGSAEATALLSMAWGAESIGDREKAEQTAREARRLATERGESEVELVASRLLESIGSGVAATRQTVSPEIASAKVHRIVADFETHLEAAGTI